jgi:hypothetical protein
VAEQEDGMKVQDIILAAMTAVIAVGIVVFLWASPLFRTAALVVSASGPGVTGNAFTVRRYFSRAQCENAAKSAAIIHRIEDQGQTIRYHFICIG